MAAPTLGVQAVSYTHLDVYKRQNKASDIDVVYIFGYGFPVYRGGPLNYANEVGLFNVLQAMARFAKNPLDDANFWQPAPLLLKLAASGQKF